MSTSWLLERMAGFGDAPAIIWHGMPLTYAALLERVAFWSSELQRHGARRGHVVALEGDYSPNACGLLLALMDLGAVSVPLTLAVRPHRDEFLQTAEVQLTADFDERDDWKIAAREAEVVNPLTRQLVSSGDPGLVVFSSGSTGRSKAVLHNVTALLEKFKTRRHRRCTLTFLLLDHLGGINTLLYTLANGGTVVSVQDRDPDVICRAIEEHRVQTLPTSPTFLTRLLISEAYRRHDLSSLELITYGTEPMPESTLARLREVLPRVQLQQTYGLSELGVLRSKSRESGSLWMRVGGEGYETKVVDGKLWIRAQSAMLGYLNAPSPFDEEGWMCTDDLVEVDGEYIRVLGRSTDLINVGGQKVYPADVESVLLQMGNVRDVSVFGEKNVLMGQIVAARFSLIEPEPLKDLKERVRTFCKDRLPSFKMPVKIEISVQEQHSARFKKVRRVST